MWQKACFLQTLHFCQAHSLKSIFLRWCSLLKRHERALLYCFFEWPFDGQYYEVYPLKERFDLVQFFDPFQSLFPLGRAYQYLLFGVPSASTFRSTLVVGIQIEPVLLAFWHKKFVHVVQKCLKSNWSYPKPYNLIVLTNFVVVPVIIRRQK